MTKKTKYVPPPQPSVANVPSFLDEYIKNHYLRGLQPHDVSLSFNENHQIFSCSSWESGFVVESFNSMKDLEEIVFQHYTRGCNDPFDLEIITPDGTFKAVPTGYKLEPA